MIQFYKEQPKFNCYRGQMLRLLPKQLIPYRIPINMPNRNVLIEVISSFDNKIAYSFRANIENGVLELKNLQYNDYYDVILKVTGSLEILYSEPIKISDYKKEFTTLVHYYKDNELLSFNAPIYFRENMINGELNTYYETSNLQTVSYFKSLSKFEKYNTELINKDVLLRLVELFRCNNVYFDLNKVNFFEFPDIGDCEGDASFTQTNLMVTKLKEKIDYNNFVVTENKKAYVVTEVEENKIITEKQ